jgi:hypothetical protein
MGNGENERADGQSTYERCSISHLRSCCLVVHVHHACIFFDGGVGGLPRHGVVSIADNACALRQIQGCFDCASAIAAA